MISVNRKSIHAPHPLITSWSVEKWRPRNSSLNGPNIWKSESARHRKEDVPSLQISSITAFQLCELLNAAEHCHGESVYGHQWTALGLTWHRLSEIEAHYGSINRFVTNFRFRRHFINRYPLVLKNSVVSAINIVRSSWCSRAFLCVLHSCDYLWISLSIRKCFFMKCSCRRTAPAVFDRFCSSRNTSSSRSFFWPQKSN